MHIILLCSFLWKLLSVYLVFTDPTEKVSIQVLSQSSTIKEGDNVTLKCSGNGNPPPQEFLFYIPVSPPLLSLCSEVFCIIPSSQTLMHVSAYVTPKQMKEGIITILKGRHWPLHQTLKNASPELAK